MKKTIDDSKRYPLLPLRDVVIFPHMVIPLFVGRDMSVKALDNAMQNDRLIVLITQTDPDIAVPEIKDLHKVGTVCEILQLLKLPNGTIKVLVEGIGRVYIDELQETDEKYFESSIKIFEKQYDVDDSVFQMKEELFIAFEEYIAQNKKIPKEALSSVRNIEDLAHMTDALSSYVSMRVELKQTLLETASPAERIPLLIKYIKGESEVLELEKKIHSQVRRHMEKTQKDYYLNEQMKIIKKELNDGEEPADEAEELTKSVEKSQMSEEAKEKAFKEIKRLSKMPPLSSESAVVRSYIEWLRDLPWQDKTRDNKNVEHAKSVLDEDHFGLDEVKERIIEFIAVKHLSNKIKGPILCFVGPPGVGKTSLGMSVARALNRKFVRIALGGVRDEAEIRGHRRTYVGSLPGKIIQAMKKSGKSNPVILLDEIDKMSTDFRGDPSSALLEVLDPEQNSTFQDHYIEIPFDLSQVLFITTANVAHQIPLPLLDRMEIIEIGSYTEIEKLNIAKKYLLPKQMKENGINESNLLISDDMIYFLIRHYTREAGVRSLERTIGKVCRKLACELVEKIKEEDRAVFVKEITPEVLKNYLGAVKYKDNEKEKQNEIGLANGLAWTSVGGDVMPIEASLVKGKGSLMLTGKLGEVMQESAQAAFTYVRSNLHIFNINPDLTTEYDLHLHVPEGAIPKDGPSAGITMGVVIASLLSKIPVKCNVAMTGEITLRGKVLPIGGLKEKVIAAHRLGITEVIIPKDNESDIEKIPESVREKIIFHPVRKMEEVLFLALESPEKLMKNDSENQDFVSSSAEVSGGEKAIHG
ncbi:MAG: endopeptidase La [Spirochaetes bacterium]|nr:endopeptidase La [Spirochaetota bacterium]